MNDLWNLDPIYRGFDDPAFLRDRDTFKTQLLQFSDFTKHLTQGEPLETLRAGLTRLESVITLGSTLGLYASLRQSADTRDAQASSMMGQLFGMFSDLAAPEAAFRSWASTVPDLQELVEQDPLLKEYRFLLSNLSRTSRFLLPGIGEEVAAKYALSGGKAWEELQQYLTSTVAVDYRGEVTNLSAIRNLAYDPDPQVRKDAYEAELACYPKIADSVAYALNSIKLETLSDCQLRGYADPLERTLMESNLSRKTLDALWDAMEERLPKFWQYLRAKGRLLGYENGLPWYELFAPVGRDTKRYTTQEARDYLVELFLGFDPELGQMVRRAFDEAWIDFYPRDGKSGGAFCAEALSLNQSRILTNFDGFFGDIVTLAHELGHAFHNQCIHTHRPLNWEYSMPLAETASTFNECVVMDYAIGNASDDDERLALIESQLQDATQIMCDIYSRFRFEQMVFEHRSQEFLPAETLCRLMHEAQKIAYGDGVVEETLHPYMWLCKSHYYGPTYYNFPYAFGGLFARGLYACYQSQGAAFVPRYKHLLYTTPIATAEDVAKVADIDLTDKAFWRSALDTVAQQIDQFCALVDAKCNP